LISSIPSSSDLTLGPASRFCKASSARPNTCWSSGETLCISARQYGGNASRALVKSTPFIASATASERAAARLRSSARSAAARKICRKPFGPTLTSRSPARTTKSEVRKNAIALTPAISTCSQREEPNQPLARISPSAPIDAALLMAT